MRVDQRLEPLPMVSDHDVGVIDLVDVDALEERLVGDAAPRVVETHVDRVAVAAPRRGLRALPARCGDAQIGDGEGCGLAQVVETG